MARSRVLSDRVYYQKNREARIIAVHRSVAKKPEVYRERNKERMRRVRAEARLVTLFVELLADLPEAVLSQICGEGRDVRIEPAVGARQPSTRRDEIEAYRKQAITRGHAI